MLNMMIKTIIKLQNDMVMVFDEDGEQVPEHQGCYEAVREELLRDTPGDAVFSHWFDGMIEPQSVRREDW